MVLLGVLYFQVLLHKVKENDEEYKQHLVI